MLDFMIIGLPRSATTWAANLFTTDDAICYHDPLHSYHYKDWDAVLAPGPAAKVGVCCTGIWRWPQWVNEHPARKLVLKRPLNEVEASLAGKGLTVDIEEGALGLINAPVVSFDMLFDEDGCAVIWEWLMGGEIPFNRARHKLLCDMYIEPRNHLEEKPANSELFYALQAELEG